MFGGKLQTAHQEKSFYRRFLGLGALDPVPDHSTISRFRNSLKAMDLYRLCFEELKRQIAAR